MKLELSPKELLWLADQLATHQEVPEVDDDDPKYFFEFMVISDIHLGFEGCLADELLSLLKYTHSNQICLAGDIIDFLMMPRNYFPQSHLTVIQKLLRKARKKVDIIYLAGNHDERVRKFAMEALRQGIIYYLGDHIALVPLHQYTTKQGVKMLILHGDEFDGKLQFSAFIEKLGGHGYELISWLDRRINRVLRLLHWKERQISAHGKSYFKKLIQRYAGSFNEAVAKKAREYGAPVVVHGHVHTPGDVIVGESDKEVRIIDVGCFTERAPMGCTALIVDNKGNFELVYWEKEKLFHFKTGKEIPPGEIDFAAIAAAETVNS